MFTLNPKISIQRAKLSIKYPYYTSHLLALNFFPDSSVRTLSIDRAGNVAYNNDHVEKRQPADLRFIILHELEHMLRKHHARFDAIFPTGFADRDLLIWQLASDFEINSYLSTYETPPDDACLPSDMQLPKNKTAEWYFNAIRQSLEKDEPPPKPGGGGESNKGSDSQGAGTGDKENKSDNQKKPQDGKGQPDGKDNPENAKNDDPQKSDKPPQQEYQHEIQSDRPQLQKHMQDLQMRSVATKESCAVYGEGMSVPEADAMAEATIMMMKQAGALHAGLTALLNSISQAPRINWRRELRAAMKKYASSAAGDFDYSYARLSRRHSDENIIFSGTVGVEINVVAILDTSASISDLFINTGLEHVHRIAKTIGGKVHVISCDTEAAYHGFISCVKSEHRMFSRGGTDLRNAIALAKKYRPTIAVLMTDGYSPFDEHRPSFPIIMLQTPDATDEVPAYFKKIKMEVDD